MLAVAKISENIGTKN